MRRRATAIAVLSAALLVPHAASAAITHSYTDNTSAVGKANGYVDMICVDASIASAATPVVFEVSTTDGQVVAKKTVTAVAGDADTNCTLDAAGNPTPAVGTQPFPAGLNLASYPAGAIVTATQGAQVVKFPLPYASIARSGIAATGPIRIRNLAAGATITKPGSGIPAGTATVNGAYDNPSITITASPITALSAVAPPSNSRIEQTPLVITAGSTDDPRLVAANGLDPRGGQATVTLLGPTGTAIESVRLNPRVGGARRANGQAASGHLTVPIPSGATLTLNQPGWTEVPFAARSVVAGTAAIDGTSVTVAVPAGSTGSYGFGPGLTFVDPGTQRAANDPLVCLDLGPATCATPAARQTAKIEGLFNVAGDSVTLSSTEADGDGATVHVTLGGITANLDDGSWSMLGAVPNSPGIVDLTNPRTGQPVFTDKGEAVNSDPDGLIDGTGFFATHINSGAQVTLSGPAVGTTPRIHTLNLAAAIAGSTVSGTTTPGAKVAIVRNDGTIGQANLVVATADAAGAYTAALADVRNGDVIRIYSADPTTRFWTTRTLYPGLPQPLIASSKDRQWVKGSVPFSATGAGLERVLWSGDFGNATAIAAPFSFTVDTKRFFDAIAYRVTASSGVGGAPSDYAIVQVDNAPPSIELVAQRVQPKNSIAVARSTSDAESGLASVDTNFGDGTNYKQTGDALGGPILHAFAKAGTYTVTVSATDVAGNVTTDKAKINVTNVPGAFLRIRGGLTRSVLHNRLLRMKFTASGAGTANISFVSQRGKVVKNQRVVFANGGTKKFGLNTKKLARGTYLVLVQFVPADGSAGPVTPLRLIVR